MVIHNELKGSGVRTHGNIVEMSTHANFCMLMQQIAKSSIPDCVSSRNELT